MILSTCRATIGQVGNLQHELVNVGKAGRSRWKSVPSHSLWFGKLTGHHPHGGGEGRAPSVDHLQCHHGVNLRLVRKTRRGKKSSEKLYRS